MASASSLATAPELTVSRVIDAPRARVFAAWTDPAQVALWWGPKGFVTTYCEMDIRPGGTYRQGMRSPEGMEHRKTGVYREIRAPERIVFTFAWEDEAGVAGHETLITVTFEEAGPGRTRLSLRQQNFAEAETRDGHVKGWTSCLERFAEFMEAGS